MYRMRHFSTIFGNVKKDATESVLRPYSIYDFYLVNDLHEYLRSLLMSPVYYALFYWMSLLLSIYGLGLAIYESHRVYHGHKVSNLFRVVQYQVFTPKTRRMIRLASCLCTVATKILLVIGVLVMIPEFMTPWLVMRTCVVAAEFSLWLRDMYCTELSKFSWRTLIAFVLAALYWLVLLNVRQTFLFGKHSGQTDGLSVIRSF